MSGIAYPNSSKLQTVSHLNFRRNAGREEKRNDIYNNHFLLLETYQIGKYFQTLHQKERDCKLERPLFSQKKLFECIEVLDWHSLGSQSWYRLVFRNDSKSRKATQKAREFVDPLIPIDFLSPTQDCWQPLFGQKKVLEN